MTLGLAAREARDRKGWSQEVVARLMCRMGQKVDKSLVCRWETGKPMTTEQVKKLALTLDDPWFYIEVENYFSPCAVPMLDGEGVDLHRVSVQVKLLEELGQAFEAVKSLKLANKPQTYPQKLLDDIHEAKQQVLDAIVCGRIWIARMCEETNESPSENHGAHKTKLESLGYLSQAKRKTALTSGR